MLNKKQFLYHEGHISARENIRSDGLRAFVPYNAPDLPKGVYMAPLSHSEYGSSMNDATHFGWDRWRVDVTGMELQTDSSQPGVTKFSPADIPPERIRLAKRADPNWERNI